MKPSIYDIAREANVSSATVSRVLNNKPSVSAHTRNKVEEVIKRLNFQPNPFARALVSKRIPTVGIMSIDVRIPHYASTAFAMERELFKLGYNSVLCNTGGDYDSNLKYLHILIEKGISGVMCLGSVFRDTFWNTSILSEFPDIPFFFSNCVLQSDNAYSVIIDERKALKLCVSHLIEKGHSQILYVKDTESYSGILKASSFLHAMEAKGLCHDKENIFTVNRGFDGGTDAVDRIINSKIPFTAIIFGDDITAIGGLKRLKEHGLSVPNDIAVIGYNNSIASTCCSPALTTVDNKTDIMGSLIVNLFQTVVEGRQTAKLLTVTPELILRDST
ncbi:MAG: LacI family transcriptional regulator [Oscillospiraceae bacterium]|nr:LacI family transcriptional regulator [Oscillospiraceae bacterium]